MTEFHPTEVLYGVYVAGAPQTVYTDKESAERFADQVEGTVREIRSDAVEVIDADRGWDRSRPQETLTHAQQQRRGMV